MSQIANITPPCGVCGESDAVKLKHGRLYCFRCAGAVQGALPAASNGQAPITQAFVEAASARLQGSSEALDWLATQRLVSPEIAKQEMLGLDGGKYQIPIPGADGWVNVRQARPGDKLRPLDKHRGVQLYPGAPAKTKRLLICEGEWDRLVALTLGFKACTGTGGAGVFHITWAQAIREAAEHVVLVYDVDHAGRAGARRAVKCLIEAGMVASEIQVVQLPLTGEKNDCDLTDWVRGGGDTAGLEALIEGTSTWELFEKPSGMVPEDAKEFPLSIAGAKDMARQWSWFPGSVIALLNDAYQLPTRVALTCPQDQGKLCGTCHMVAAVADTPPGEAPMFDLDTTDDRFVEHIGTPKFKLKEQVLASLGVQHKCPVVVVEDLKSVPVQEGRIGEMLTVSADRKAAERSAIFIDLEDVLEPNKEYLMLGRFMPHPRDQVWTAVVHRAKGVDQVVDNFKESKKVLAPLRRTKKLEMKLAKILRDAEEVTLIRERSDMHLLVLLSMMSTLYLKSGDELERGWLDVALVGDSSEGKSVMTEKLQEWIGLGSVLAMKRTTTRAGLFGGVVLERKKPTIAWGVYPRHDRRWMALDEVHTADLAIISAMTSSRSKGVAEAYMASIAAQTHCRVRLCWIMNPRNEHPVAAHSYGIDVVKYGFKRPEDIRRLDAALVVAKGEVDVEVLKRVPRKDPQLFTRELARHLTIRAWAQWGVPIDHLFDVAHEHRTDLCSRYTVYPPLLEPNDLVWKLLRLAAALANLVGAPKPTQEHVHYVAGWLDKIYSSEVCGLAALSKLERLNDTLKDEKSVVQALHCSGDFTATVELLLMQPEWRVLDFQMLAPGGEREVGQQMLSILVRNRAMVREGSAYRKSPPFVRLLKQLQEN